MRRLGQRKTRQRGLWRRKGRSAAVGLDPSRKACAAAANPSGTHVITSQRALSLTREAFLPAISPSALFSYICEPCCVALLLHAASSHVPYEQRCYAHLPIPTTILVGSHQRGSVARIVPSTERRNPSRIAGQKDQLDDSDDAAPGKREPEYHPGRQVQVDGRTLKIERKHGPRTQDDGRSERGGQKLTEALDLVQVRTTLRT